MDGNDDLPQCMSFEVLMGVLQDEERLHVC